MDRGEGKQLCRAADQSMRGSDPYSRSSQQIERADARLRSAATIFTPSHIWLAARRKAGPSLEMEMPCVRIMRFLRFGD